LTFEQLAVSVGAVDYWFSPAAAFVECPHFKERM